MQEPCLSLDQEAVCSEPTHRHILVVVPVLQTNESACTMAAIVSQWRMPLSGHWHRDVLCTESPRDGARCCSAVPITAAIVPDIDINILEPLSLQTAVQKTHLANVVHAAEIHLPPCWAVCICVGASMVVHDRAGLVDEGINCFEFRMTGRVAAALCRSHLASRYFWSRYFCSYAEKSSGEGDRLGVVHVTPRIPELCAIIPVPILGPVPISRYPSRCFVVR